MDRLSKKILTFFSLFGSVSTLLCCALPVTLVSLGMGATFASMTSRFPQILWITEKKDELFIITAILLTLSYFSIRRSEKMACPIDKDQAKLCGETKVVSRKLFWATVVIYITGLLFSYVIPRVFYGM